MCKGGRRNRDFRTRLETYEVTECINVVALFDRFFLAMSIVPEFRTRFQDLVSFFR
jgi:hypothetical protein